MDIYALPLSRQTMPIVTDWPIIIGLANVNFVLIGESKYPTHYDRIFLDFYIRSHVKIITRKVKDMEVSAFF